MNQLVAFASDYSGIVALPGAVRSAEGMAVLLRDRGYLCNRVFDSLATKAEFVNTVSSMLAAASPGDDLRIQINCHGAIVPVVFLDGTTRPTPCLVPWDAVDAAGSFIPANLVTPWEWLSLMSALPPGVRCLAIIDTCYAGGIAGPTAAALIGATTAVRQSLPYAGEPIAAAIFSGAPQPAARFAASAIPGLIEFVPCSATQESVELVFGPGLRGVYYSLFTYWVLRAMQLLAMESGSVLDYFYFARARASKAWPTTPALYGSRVLLTQRFLP